MKNLYLVEQHSSTFGQTEAGCHHSQSAKRVVAQVTMTDMVMGIYPDKGEVSEFFEQAHPEVVIYTPKGDIRIPVEASYTGIRTILALRHARKGDPSLPYVSCRSWAVHEIVYCTQEEMDAAIAASKPEVFLDGGNLNYQRALLGR
jgi:hypothetical protein